jgi:S-adenosylmethionine-diacylgycerolhomoserine-N-methlytransferase
MSTADINIDQVSAMDRMYRYTRHVYDASRRYYLVGRDRLIDAIALQPGQTALEIGCGTARNLVLLHRRFPHNRLYGIDAANVMIRTAQAKVQKAGAKNLITLRQGLAETLTYRTFGVDRPFDVIFFSYSLSMIPHWKAALDAALTNLKPGGELWVVDFWDQRDLPRWFSTILKKWLAMFHVHYRPELHDHLHELEDQGLVAMDLKPIARRYAYMTQLRKR